MDRADVHRDKLFIKGEGAEGEADSFPLGDGVGGFRGPFLKDDQGAGQHPDRCMTAGMAKIGATPSFFVPFESLLESISLRM